VPNAKAGAVTRFGSNVGYSNYLISQAFGHAQQDPLPDGFMGIYYDSLNNVFYLAIRANNAWKTVLLSAL
jgi:hypothetical protein